MNDTVSKIDEFSWLDGIQTKTTGLDKRAQIMREGGQEGKDRIWYCDGEYIWFRREKSNPATLERHNRFVANGDYVHVETQDGVEVWQLKPQSMFTDSKKAKQFDISKLSFYDLRRQAALAACRRDWAAFRDIMSFLRERINASYRNPNGGASALAENIYADQYTGVMLSIEQRDGPTPGEINRELNAMNQRKGLDKPKLITIGGDAAWKKS